MPRSFISLLFLILAVQAHAALSGTKSIGPSGDYASITAAITDIQTQGLGGPLVLELQAGYASSVETFPITFSNLGTSITNPLTLRPAADATALSISSSTGAATVDLNGATYVTLDGRPAGLGTTKQLTISSTNTGSGSAVRLINGASNNILQHLTLRGASGSVNIGVVLFSSTNVANGNNNNLIDNCDIGDSTLKPAVGIVSRGAPQPNKNNTVSNCHLFNFSSSSDIASGIFLSTGNTDWTIYGNSFYGSLGGIVGIRAVYINTAPLGNNFNITHNFFGGTGPDASGTSVQYTTPSFTAIYLNVDYQVQSIIEDNVVQLIGVNTSTAITTLPGVCCGIYVPAGFVDIKNNHIGLAFNNPGFGTVNTFTVTASQGGSAYGICANSSAVNILNNVVEGMVVTASGTGAGTLTGIEADNVSGTVSGNTVGSTVLPNSFNLNGSGTLFLNGIGTFNSTAIISNNTVANLTNTCNVSGTGQTRGINTSTGNPVSGNSVHHLSSNSPRVSSTEGNVSGISTTGGSQSVSHNLVYALSNTNTLSTVGVTGIYYFYNGTPSTPSVLEGNFIHGLSVSPSNSSSYIAGMFFGSGKCAVQNNMVRVGLDEGGASTGNTGKVWGINDASGTNEGPSLYYNSVYVGGTQTSGSRSSFAFQSTAVTNPRDYRNNLFVNVRSQGGTATGKSYAAAYGGGGANPAGLTASNNLFFANGAGTVLGSYGGDQTDLASWQAATGVDANSIVGDPLYNNPTGTSATVDLHLQNASPARSAGVAISGITLDIDGQTRSATTPAIGADEIGEPDIAVEQPSGTGLVDGVSTVDFGNVPVGGSAIIKFFNIRNLGTASLTGLSFTIDGLNAGDFAVTPASSQPLAPGANEFISVTFLPPAIGTRRATLHIASNDFDEPSFDVTLTGKAYNVNATYQQWAQTSGVSNDPSDLGANGLKNLLNFGFGLNPSSSFAGALAFTGDFTNGGTITSNGMPITRQEGNDLRALFVRRKDYATVGLTYTVQFSADLSTWLDSTDTPTVLADDGTSQIVSVPYPAGFSASGFFRVSLTLP